MKQHNRGATRAPSLVPGLLLTVLCLLAAPQALQAQTAFNPFSLISDRADVHLMAWFEGHPEYEAVEAYIYQTGYPTEKPAIRAIVTRHGGEQEDYLNSDGSGTAGVDRKRHRCDISLRQAVNGQDWFLGFRLADGQDCALVYIAASPPDPAYGGLTDVGAHSADGGLPLFWREASGMGGKGSYVRIGETRYRVSPDPAVSKPPFFYGYKAYLTLGMDGMILPTGDFHLSFPADSDAAKPRAPLSKIAGASAGMGISFTPTLPDWRELGIGESRSLHFSVDFPESKGACVGSITLKRDGQAQATLLLSPDKPRWAAADRRMIYTIEERADEIHVSCRMAEARP